MNKLINYIGKEKLTFRAIFEIFKENRQIQLSASAAKKIEDCRAYLDKKTESDLDPIYGINTGI